MTTLVLLPGMDGTGMLFAPLIEALSDRFPVEVVRYPLAAPAGYADLKQFAKTTLEGKGPLVLLGESFSGPIAISLTAKLPAQVKGLILCCTFARNPYPLLSPFKFMAGLAPIKQLPTSFASMALLGRHASPSLRFALRAALDSVSAAALRMRSKAVLSVDVSSDLAKVTAPILYMRASEDRLIPSSAGSLIQSIQPATHVVDLMGPHCLLQVAPAESARVIQEFLGLVG